MSSTNKSKCLKSVRGNKFEAEAISVCTKMFSTADKINCVDAIANREYHPTELKICRDMLAVKNKITCLGGAAVVRTPIKKTRPNSVKDDLHDALFYLDKGKNKRAKKLIRLAISKLP